VTAFVIFYVSFIDFSNEVDIFAPKLFKLVLTKYIMIEYIYILFLVEVTNTNTQRTLSTLEQTAVGGC